MQFFRLKDGQYHSTKGLNSRKRDSKVIDGVAQTHEVGYSSSFVRKDSVFGSIEFQLIYWNWDPNQRINTELQ